ncbi:hypothetical protein GCM10011371_04380 [Novosphingobium marinum]|uniref:Argininosuccinate lyase n=1 Tax=Novosphingobium marinum TaxID=1514948 RepID=A0A7Z0BSG9_9SPHN|nr:hypothetical protein [Novosphingobium marinum]NYH94129.1 hypothetical protein [Novosphingobium marinum]GGC19799.1 hypothetical protein GCM10011371_04380 [Novosphingobium marinum]
MKRIAAFLAALSALFAALPASAEEVLTIVNRTGYPLAQIYISPSDTNDWEENLLGRSGLANGRQWRIDFSRSANTCIWDMRIVYADGYVYDWGGLNLCRFATAIITYDEASGETYVQTR